MQIYAARTPSLARLLTEGTAAGSFDLSCMPSLAQADVCPIIPTNGAAPLRCWQAPPVVTDAALLARGFKSTVISGLVESGLTTLVTERIWADGRRVEVRSLRLTDAGRSTLGR